MKAKPKAKATSKAKAKPGTKVKAKASARSPAKKSPEPKLSPVEKALRTQGLAYPETREDFPWGHRTLKVKGKAFAFMSTEGGGFSISVKLPQSAEAAVTLPFAEPTGYGLGRSGWVTASFAKVTDAPTELLSRWLVESYRAVAPKNLGDKIS